MDLSPTNDRDALNIVSHAVSPVVGVPAILARCINARTPHRCRCVWATNVLPNGVAFEGDIQWRDTPSDAEDVLQNAELIIVHNGAIHPAHTSLFAGKAIVVMAHQAHYVDPTFVRRGFPCVVVGQHQATFAEYRGWSVVPNPIPLWEEHFRPGERKGMLTVCFTPSDKHERYPLDHWSYWHSKGYRSTMEILDRLAARFAIRLETVSKHPLDHINVLELKRRAHIVIDECVTGSYHRNSLEGLATGCVVLNALGSKPEIMETFRFCAGDESSNPFTYAELSHLEAVLHSLLARGAEDLAEQGASNRQWMERYWDFTKQWKQFWMPVVTRLLIAPGGSDACTGVSS
jgi:hypothetical protein